jgi:predicted GIY-YIG superfamily endonuclease
MYFVYILKSRRADVHYVGMAKDVQRRLSEHNAGKSRYTKAYVPFELIYCEGPFETKMAREREKYLKKTENKRKVIQSLK